MKITMKVDVTGTRQSADGVSGPWPARGEQLEVSDDEGKGLCDAGIADPVVDMKVQKATAPKAETR